jgi:hypothetical protein
MSLSACLVSAALAAQASTPPGTSATPPGGASANSKAADRGTLVKIATELFGEAVQQVQLSHEKFSSTTRASVIYEELKLQSRSSNCAKALAQAKTDSSRARKELGKAVEAASNRFDSAVKMAARIDAEFFKKGIGRSSDEEFPWYPRDERDKIRARMKSLDTMFRVVDSSMTSDERRADLWAAAGEYEAFGSQHGLPVGAANALVPGSISIPCIGKTVSMHVTRPKQ